MVTPASLHRADILSICAEAGRPDMVFEFASTSKITLPGAGVACLGGGDADVAVPGVLPVGEGGPGAGHGDPRFFAQVEEVLEDFRVAREVYHHIEKVFLADGDALVRKAVTQTQNTVMACSSSSTGGREGAMRMLLSRGSFP